jgi:L-lactate dehydrogenase complex protein LldF
VRIDIHHHLLHNRRNAARTAPNAWERLGHRFFVAVASRPWLFAAGGGIFRRCLPLLRLLRPPLLRSWLATRDLPAAPQHSFRSRWNERQRRSQAARLDRTP